MKEFKPALIFLVKFLGLYFLLNILYGIYFESFAPLADPLTYNVTGQSIWFLDFFYNNLDYEYYPYDQLVWMSLDNNVILSAFEGCNGVNVIILFISFIVAFSGPLKDSIIYIIGGILVIHVFNVLRISLLFVVAEKYYSYLYFTHKYLFTGFIYAVVFALWFLWVRRVNGLKKSQSTTA